MHISLFHFEIRQHSVRPARNAHGLFACKFFVWCIIGLVMSCKSPEPAEIEARQTIQDSTYLVFKDIYYWSDRLPERETFKPWTFTTVPAVIDAIRTYSPVNRSYGQEAPIDRWSYAVERSTWDDAIINKNRSDWGMGIRFVAEDDLRIAWVQPKSPAGMMGLQRGMRILKIDHVEAGTKNLQHLENVWANSDKMTLTVGFNGKDSTIALSNDKYNSVNILDSKILADRHGMKFGYVNIAQFLNGVDTELEEVFKNFNSNGVRNLIIDVRYNPGGFINKMNNVASLIGSSKLRGKVMTVTTHNKDYRAFDEKSFFEDVPGKMENIEKVYFLTAYRTASASEMLIWALKPYLDVKVIGTGTEGKLVGSYAFPVGEYVLSPISFLINNAEGSCDEFMRITPDTEVFDDPVNGFDEDEALIACALRGGGNARVQNRNRPSSVSQQWMEPSILPPFGFKVKR